MVRRLIRAHDNTLSVTLFYKKLGTTNPMTELEVWQWIADQGTTVVGFALGCWGGHFFTKKVYAEKNTVETERYNHLKQLVDQLRDDMKESERLCAERIEKMESKYTHDLQIIKELAESNERKSLAMISSLSDLARVRRSDVINDE